MRKFSPTLCRCPWCSACWRTCASPSCRSSSSDPPQAAYKFKITKKCKNSKEKVAPAHHLCHAQKLKQLNVYLHGKNRAKATVPLSWQIFIYGQLLGVAQIHFVPIHYIKYHDQCQGMASPILRLLFPQKTLDSELNIKTLNLSLCACIYYGRCCFGNNIGNRTLCDTSCESTTLLGPIPPIPARKTNNQ